MARNKDSAQLLASARRMPSLAVLLFMVSILLVFNFSARKLLQYFLNSQEQDLAEHLRGVARMVEYELSHPYTPLIITSLQDRTAEEQGRLLDSFDETVTYEDLTSRLMDFQDLNRISRISLMTTQGVVIADSRRSTLPGEPNVFVDIDRQQFERAREGSFDQVRLYQVGKEYFLRLYAPFNIGNRVGGIVQLAASAQYIKQYRELSNRVKFQVLLSSLLLLLIGISIYRLFRYVVRIENSAMQAARIEAMGALAAGVAHELRNPLSIIRMLSEEISSEGAAGSQSARNARDIIAETERLNEMVTNFLSLSRSPEMEGLTSLDLVEVVSRVIELMKKGMEHNMSLRLDAPSAPVMVPGDERAIRQVLLNLLINARESLPPKGGRIAVTLRERRSTAELVISDNGHGIPARDLSRIFEPFYTTKKMGTGLGLPISRSIVENLNGKLTVASKLDEGTQITISLPLSASSSRRPGSSSIHSATT
jgi:signal transduction histidine kinase